MPVPLNTPPAGVPVKVATASSIQYVAAKPFIVGNMVGQPLVWHSQTAAELSPQTVAPMVTILIVAVSLSASPVTV